MIFRKFLILVIVILIHVSIVNAASFDVEAVPINSKINIDEFAIYQINIKNNLRQVDEYRIYTSSFPTWDVRTDPIVNPITLNLDPNSEGSVEVVVDPLKIRDIGTYAVNLNVRSKVTDTLTTVPLKVSILSTEGLIGGYVPTVVTFVSIPEKIDPRDEIPIKITLNNQNIIDYPELTIKIESELVKDTITTTLGPKEEKILEFAARLNPLTLPQEDTLVVALFREERSIINPIVKNIEIVEYRAQNLVSEDKKFFITKSNYEFASNNPDYEGTLKVETTLFESIFSSQDPNAKIVSENGKRYFVWDIELENNRMHVSVTKNLLPLFLVIILAVASVVLYYTFRSPLVIRKETSHLGKSEGGLSEMSVILHIKNRGKSKIKDLHITETIPSIVSVEREVSIGSMQPSKVLRHERKGTTIVKWSVDNLDVSEERVLSYKIKSRLSILGNFSLPAAAAMFKYDNKTYTSTSNRLNVNG